MMDYTIESLAAEQDELHLPYFDYDFAWQLGSLMRERAVNEGLAVAITVAHGGDAVFAAILPGATPFNLQWEARKRAVARLLQRSSLSLRLEAEKGGFDFNAAYRLPPDYVASGGGVPLILRNGTLIGTVGVSGIPSDVADHRFIIEALRAMLGK